MINRKQRYFGLDKIDDEKQLKLMKRFIKDAYKINRKNNDNLSLTTCGHYRTYEDNYEKLTEYGFFPKDVTTEEQAMEYFDYYMRRTICSPYDCTGKLFTADITIHKNPCGLISYIHESFLDV